MTSATATKAATKRDPVLKRTLRSGYRWTQAATVLTASRDRGVEPRVYYGGARAGDRGGPLVKVKRLRQFFPEHKRRFNLAYVLSNTPYLPAFALRALKSRGIPIVHNQNGVFYPAWYDGDWQGQNARMALSYMSADHVFFQSDFCRRAADEFLGPRQGAWDILHNAVDTDHFSPSPAGAEHDPNAPVLLITGKLTHHLFYRIDSTVRGLALARETGLKARLVIAGSLDSETQTRTRSLAESLHIADAVTLTGPYTQSAAPDVYRGADIYITTKHNDPCPNAVIEALACGLPVIYSDSGGVPELVGPDAGVALSCVQGWEKPSAPDVNDIADAMVNVAKCRPAMTQHARQRAVQSFDIRDWIERHRQVFTELLEKRS